MSCTAVDVIFEVCGQDKNKTQRRKTRRKWHTRAFAASARDCGTLQNRPLAASSHFERRVRTVRASGIDH
jgi:hypothetical protein